MKRITIFKTLTFALFFLFSINSSKGQATLPFTYDSGKPTTVTGLTHNGLGSDYAASPKMKFDTTDDNLILFFNGTAGTLTFNIKWNQSTAATRFPGDFTLMESTDGTNYTVIQTYNSTNGTALENGVTKTETFTNISSDTRYLKWVYTTKTNGNIAIGNINLSSKNANEVASPKFTPSGGNYTTTQSITITSSTEGASIYYTINGDDPTETSQLYSTPISVSSTSTIKAKAFKSGYTSSSVASATYTFPTEVADIAALRAATTPGFYKLTGEAVLTLKSATRNAKYIQDNSGAVLIDDASGKITTNYNLGDGIKGITGTTAIYNGMLQFTPVEDPGAANSTGNVVSPAAATLENLSAFEAKLVKVSGVTISDITGGTGVFTAGKSFPLNTSTTAVLRTQYNDLDYIGTSIPTAAQDIVGVVLIYNTTIQLVPRSAAGITASLGTGLNKISHEDIFISKGEIVVSAAANERIEIYNAVGQKLAAKTAIEGLNHISVNAKGIILVKAGNRTAKLAL